MKTEKFEEISVPRFEGFKCLGMQPRIKGYYILSSDCTRLLPILRNESLYEVVYERIPPKRCTFEETGEYRKASHGEYYLNSDNNLSLHNCLKDTVGLYRIYRRIDE